MSDGVEVVSGCVNVTFTGGIPPANKFPDSCCVCACIVVVVVFVVGYSIVGIEYAET